VSMRFPIVVAAILTLASTALAADPEATEFYDVTTEGSSQKVKAGEQGQLIISIKAKNGAHVSDEAPLKIELSSPTAALTKSKLSLADSVSAKKEGAPYPDPRFVVPFTPSAHGRTTVEAKMTFFICTEKQCARQTKTLSLPVEVM
jgi:hypothetical protein